MLFYLMIKNHPFQNGNKRVAVLTLLVLLSENGRWLKVDNMALYTFAKRIAESDSSKTKEVVKEIVDFMDTHITLSSDSSEDELEED